MRRWLLALAVAWLANSVRHVSVYQIRTAIGGVRGLLSLPREAIDRCTAAYAFFQSQPGTTVGSFAESDTDVETEHVRAYYTVTHHLLSIADIEKLYIPPQLDASLGLFGNQLLLEEHIFRTLALDNATESTRLLDIGCGRGRVAHHAATATGAHVSGFNVDADQIANAVEYAAATGMASRLDFKVGDHHKRFAYPDASFDGAYSIQAIWPFFKKDELDAVSAELYRVLKPGASFSCSEYLLTPHFDHANERHMELHRLFLPTLAATQSNYPADVVAALQRAGFRALVSAPSVAPAWPITDQKTSMFQAIRAIVAALARVGALPQWAEVLCTNFLLGGQAWAAAEKAKLADLNWQIVVQKPP